MSDSLLNRTAVRKLILQRAKARGRDFITRVSEKSLLDLEADLRVLVDKKLDSHPSVGQTFNP